MAIAIGGIAPMKFIFFITLLSIVLRPTLRIPVDSRTTLEPSLSQIRDSRFSLDSQPHRSSRIKKG
jgi:hypothetical protein